MSLGPTFSKPTVKNTSTAPSAYTYTNYSDAIVSIMGQHNFKNKIGVLLDIGICHRGTAITQPVSVLVLDPNNNSLIPQDEKNKYRQDLSYLDNYLLTKYTLGNKLKVYGNAGIYYSLLLKSRKRIVDEYYDYYAGTGPSLVKGVHAGDLQSSYKGSDIGIAAGLGVTYGRFGLDYRYCLGIKNISKTPEVNKIYSSFSTLKLTLILVRATKETLPHTSHHKNKLAR